MVLMVMVADWMTSSVMLCSANPKTSAYVSFDARISMPRKS